MVLTPRERKDIKEKFIKLTTSENPLSQRQAWRQLSGEFQVSVITVRYHTNDRYREQVKKSSSRANKTNSAREYQKKRRADYYSNPKNVERSRLYSRLYQSQLAREILPKVMSKNEAVSFEDLGDIIETETDINFGPDTLKKLLLDRYSESARGPPIEELVDQPGRYVLREEFYEASNTDQPQYRLSE